jgi:hypothetical protein
METDNTLTRMIAVHFEGRRASIRPRIDKKGRETPPAQGLRNDSPSLRRYLLAANKIHVSEMISEEFPLSKAPLAFKHATQRGAMKVVLRG